MKVLAWDPIGKVQVNGRLFCLIRFFAVYQDGLDSWVNYLVVQQA